MADRLKARARGAVADALRRGSLVCPRSCSDCGETTKLEAHHTDYSQPLAVVWVCEPCHSVRHLKTHCIHGHEYTDANTYVRSNGKRHCRQCRAVAQLARRYG